MPVGGVPRYDGYFNTSPGCWKVFTEVLASEYGNAVLFGQAHQLTVDTYAVQHAGGAHPDKSVVIHLTGLYLVLEKNLKPPTVPKHLQRLSDSIESWPHFPPPDVRAPVTIRDIADATSPERHMVLVREWARSVWGAWSPYHAQVARLAQRYLAIT
jgi:hypothetical protein